ncbi:MAG: hypothetical protein RI973_2343 [Bacteroidota bacterium]|jgi:thioredoxin-related protein
MRKTTVILAIAFSGIALYSFTSGRAQSADPAAADIQWVTWEQLAEKSKKERRKVVVDVYTDWCGWCKRMDATTFSQPQIVRYVNEKYYAVKFNAEMKEDITFKGEEFRFVKNGMRGYHELAAKITSGRLSYPTVVFLDENLEVIQAIPGYRDAREFEMIMTYFGENQYQKVPWETYQEKYKPLTKN